MGNIEFPLNKRYLITGGAGFIGSELVNQLAKENVEIVIVDNLINGKYENIEEKFSHRKKIYILHKRSIIFFIISGTYLDKYVLLTFLLKRYAIIRKIIINGLAKH